MLLLLLTFLVASCATTLFGYVAHLLLHQPWMGRFNQAHLTHHDKLYPPSDFFSDTYRSAGKDNSVILFAILGIPLLLIPVLLFYFKAIGLFTMLFAMASMIGIGLLHDRVHDSFHLNNHWLKILPFYRKWLDLHYQHHVNVKTNYGIFLFVWDKLFKTYKEN